MKSAARHPVVLAAVALSVLVVGRHPSEILDATPPGFNIQAAKAIQPSWGFARHTQQTHNVQKLHGSHGKTNIKSVAAILGAYQRLSGLGYGYQNITPTNAYGTQYATEVLFNGHPLYLLVDTGSSDTWAVQSDFDCIDYASESIPQIACQFGPAYPNSFQYGTTQPDQHMFIRYGDGEIVAGPMGYSDVTVGNITVTKQEICLANTTYWFGNNMTSGLIGLAFPALTNAYLGSGLDHNRGSRIEYSPLFTSMVSQGKVTPVFSIALDRNSTGTLAWGGIAPAVGMNTSKIASLDMIIVSSSWTP